VVRIRSVLVFIPAISVHNPRLNTSCLSRTIALVVRIDLGAW
jgi:hypothetical protein